MMQRQQRLLDRSFRAQRQRPGQPSGQNGQNGQPGQPATGERRWGEMGDSAGQQENCAALGE
jgi:hypothetical protein